MAPLDLWVLILLSFALGAVLVLIYFVYDHIKQRQVIRQLRQNVEILTMELKRAGVAGGGSSSSASAPGPSVESQEHPQE